MVRIAKTLRKRPPKRFKGFKFRRQQPVGAYIVDFVCFERQIVIEVDGGGHAFEKAKDNERDTWLQGEGFQVLRFWNNDVLQNIDGVLEVIRGHALNHPPLTPPLKGGEQVVQKKGAIKKGGID
jgi:very-short-patch-repair endonuclease